MKKKIICALDNNDLGLAYSTLASIADHIDVVKLGTEFFYSCGIQGVKKISEIGLPIFLDLKLHDIPNTVSKTLKVIREIPGIFMITTHISGGEAMLTQAKEVLTGSGILLLGVSVLTSLDQIDLEQLGISCPISEHVIRLCNIAQKANLDGIVCSTQEAKKIKDTFGDKFIVVTPGISLSSTTDQKRIMKPELINFCASDYLVIGRAITDAKCPATAVKEIKSLIQ